MYNHSIRHDAEVGATEALHGDDTQTGTTSAVAATPQGHSATVTREGSYAARAKRHTGRSVPEGDGADVFREDAMTKRNALGDITAIVCPS